MEQQLDETRIANESKKGARLRPGAVFSDD
jgi:hypothetical protein